MANPQADKFTRISNELLEALAKIRIPGEARQIFDVIVRKTYGFNKKSDPIALSQFSLATKLKKVTVCKAIKKLLELNVITKKGNAIAFEYGINKDFDTWKPLPKKVMSVTKKGNEMLSTTMNNGITKKGNEKPLPKKVMSVTKKGNDLLPKKDTTKDTLTKDTLTKDTIVEIEDFEPQISDGKINHSASEIQKYIKALGAFTISEEEKSNLCLLIDRGCLPEDVSKAMADSKGFMKNLKTEFTLRCVITAKKAREKIEKEDNIFEDNPFITK